MSSLSCIVAIPNTRINQPTNEKIGKFYLCQVKTSSPVFSILFGTLSVVPAGSDCIYAKETTKHTSLPDPVT